MSAEGDKSILPGKQHKGVGYIRGNGPDGYGMYEVKWSFIIDIEGFVEISHKVRRLDIRGS